jgi:hypothetical protein
LLTRIAANAAGFVVRAGESANRQEGEGICWGYGAVIDAIGRTVFVADAHRGDGKRSFCERMKS